MRSGRVCTYLIHNNMGQGAQVSVLLELPEENSGSAVQEAGPVPRQVLHPDLVSAQRRLNSNRNVIIEAGESALEPLTLAGKAGRNKQIQAVNERQPWSLVRRRSPAPG